MSRARLPRGTVPIVALVLAGVAALWLGLATLMESEYALALGRAEARAASLARLAEENLQRSLDAAAALHELGQIEAEFGPRGAAERAASPVYRELKRLMDREQFGFVQVAATDETGMMTWSTVGPDAARVDLSDRIHVRVPLAGTPGLFVGEVVVGRVSQRATMQISRRMQGPDGRPLGVIVASFDPLSLDPFFSDLGLGPEDEAVVVRAGGMIIASSRGRHRVAQRLEDEAALDRAPRNGEAALAVTGHGRRILSVRSQPGIPLTVAVSLDADAALRSFHAYRRDLNRAGWAASIFAFALLVALYGWNLRRARMAEAAFQLAAAQTSEARFRAMAASLGDLVLVHEPDGRISHAGGAAQRLLGEEPEALQGRHMLLLTHPADRVEVARAFALAAETGSARTREHRAATAGGGWVWLETGIERLAGDGAAGARLISSSRDVGQRMAAERELRTAHAQVNQLLEAAPVVLFGLRQGAMGWEIGFLSANLGQVLGWNVAEAMQPGWWTENLHPDDREAAVAALRRVQQDGRASVDYRFRTRAGEWRYTTDTMVCTTGGAYGIVGSWADVTEQHALRDQLVQASKLATLGEMATGMAHELNQPLAVIGTATESLLERLKAGMALPVQALQPKLERILRMTHRAAAIIEHMRVFGRIKGDAVQPVELPAVVQGMQTIVGPRLAMAMVTLEEDWPEEELPQVLGDAMLLEQVLLNLVSNACDAFEERPVPAGGRRIVLAAARRGAMVDMTVHDNAGGIPPTLIGKVFEPFFTTKPAGKGTGLGLAISFGILRDLGGALRVENVAGGACFTLSLPAAPAEAPPAIAA